MIKHTITIDDRTTFLNTGSPVVNIDENILIVGSFQRGPSNQLVQFYPGEVDRFLDVFGPVNYNLYGIGPNIAVKALDNTRNMGVLVANLRADDARVANAILVAKHKVLPNVQKVNAQGDPLYITPEGVETTVAAGNQAIVRDVLEAKYSVVTNTGIKGKLDVLGAVNAPYSATPDVDGYVTTPLFGFYYVGAGQFGNNISARMVEKESPFSGDTYYDMEVFDGTGYVYINDVSLFPDAEMYKGQTAFIETILNGTSDKLKLISSSHLDAYLELIKKYTVEPMKVNLFDPIAEYQYQVAGGSLDVTAPRAIKLASGLDGTAPGLDAMIKDFFDAKIVKDLDSLLRYKIDIIPDLEFGSDIKKAIIDFTKRRFNTTNTIMMMGTGTFESAIAERNNTYAEKDTDTALFIADVQNPASYDPYTRRTTRLPAIFYMMEAYIDAYKANGHSYLAFAGSGVRWKGFDPESLVCPPNNDAFDKLLTDARINVVKMDSQPGAYIASQNTNTLKISDRTEFNNMRLISNIVWDINNLVHENGYRFNEIEDVEKFQEKVQLDIYSKYRLHVAGISVAVYKKGLTGIDKNTNYINVMINFKDLSKVTHTTLVITDEEIK